MKRTLILACFLLVVVFAIKSIAKNQIMKPHELIYDVQFDGIISIDGIMVQTLRPLANNKWRFKRQATALGFKAEDISEVSFINDTIRSIKYTKNDFVFIGEDPVSFSINDADTYDIMTVVLQLAQDLNNGLNIENISYRVQTDSDSFEEYRVRIEGTEIISTQAGKFDTLKITKIEEPDKNVKTSFWLYPDASHIIIKGVSVKDNGTSVTLTLKKGIIANTNLGSP